VFRIGHLGDTNDLTIIGALAGVEMGLALAGVPHRQGRGAGRDGYFAAAASPAARRRSDALRHELSRGLRSPNRRLPDRRPAPAFLGSRPQLLSWLCDPKARAVPLRRLPSLKRNYLPPDYLRDVDGLKIVKTVHIQANWGPDRSGGRDAAGSKTWRANTAIRTRFVGAAYFARDDIGEVLAKHAKEQNSCAACAIFPAAAETIAQEARGAAGSMDDPKWRSGYALLEKHGFSFDLQTPMWHLDAAADLARDFPKTQIVIVHTGLPSDRSAEGLAGWRAALETVAAQPNVAIKISGLGRPGLPWTLTANGAIVRDAINIFGPERAMFQQLSGRQSRRLVPDDLRGSALPFRTG